MHKDIQEKLLNISKTTYQTKSNQNPQIKVIALLNEKQCQQN